MTSIQIGSTRKPRPAHVSSYVAPRPEPSDGGRRVFNVTMAATGLVLVAPLMLVIAVLIKLTSQGSVFYTQTRIGIDRRKRGAPAGNSRRKQDFGGRPFRIYKFRSMANRTGHSPDGEVWAQPDDPRVTRVGRILRLYRLDELPQLINVLCGDMNIVGPRPEQPTIFARLRTEIARYQERQRVHPGITGWAQINQNYDSCVDDVRRKLAYDLEYVQRRSTLEDLRIMLRTVPVMLFKVGGW